jgi:chromosome segregation ATPase
VAVERLERLLRETRTRLADLRARETSLNNTANSLQGRVESARQELKATLAATEPADKAPGSVAGESAAITQARMDQWLVDRELKASRVARLETEALTIPERLGAVQAELKLVTAQREQAEKFLAELLGMDNLKRIGEAEQLREEVRAKLPSPNRCTRRSWRCARRCALTDGTSPWSPARNRWVPTWIARRRSSPRSAAPTTASASSSRSRR